MRRYVFVLVLATLLSGCGLTVSNPRKAEPRITIPETEALPRVMRYVSQLPGNEGQAVYGLVLEDDEGIPTRVLNLTALKPSIGSTLDRFVENGGFELADRLASNPVEIREHRALIETLNPDRLADVVLPVVSITEEDLRSGRRASIGVGLNYGEHREETNLEDADKSLFPKVAPTTGAYSPVSLGVQVDEPEKPVLLGDYEVEIGFVTLEDIDLNALPDEEEFARSIAWFQGNDVSDREPIVRYGEAGFTRGKSHPTYTPVGPWMVHGRHLRPKTMIEGEDELAMNLAVDEASPAEGGRWRQGDTSASMIDGPYAILRIMAEHWERSAMLDADGRERALVPMRDGKPFLPRGSIVLTGTPGGTAIKAPGPADMAKLFIRGAFSPARAREVYVRHAEANRRTMGFLQPGDVVEARVELLGRQRWRVID